jgi:hypothetical protein
MTRDTLYTWIASVLIFALFVFFVVLPFVDQGRFWPRNLTLPHYGIIHLPSFGFILLSLGVYALLAMFESVQRRPRDMDRHSPGIAKQRLEAVLAAGSTRRPEAGGDGTLNRFLAMQIADNPILKTIDAAVRRGHGGEALESAVAIQINKLTYFHHFQARYWSQVASTLPLLGMTGTIAGLLFMFASGDTGTDRAAQLAGLGIALLTTLYASLLTVLVVKPIASDHGHKVEDIAHDAREIVLLGKRLVASVSPRQIEDAKQQQVEVGAILHGR